jgi:hypothetical protein
MVFLKNQTALKTPLDENFSIPAFATSRNTMRGRSRPGDGIEAFRIVGSLLLISLALGDLERSTHHTKRAKAKKPPTTPPIIFLNSWSDIADPAVPACVLLPADAVNTKKVSRSDHTATGSIGRVHCIL